MTTSKLEANLMALDAEKSRYTRRIERVLPLIEDALAKGATREAIVAVLQQDGINVNLNGFATALYRLRKKRDANAAAQTQVNPSPAIPAPAAVTKIAAAAPAIPVKTGMSIRDIARNRPNLAELERIGREAATENSEAKP